jgi:NAD(P)-dependent dehydrogenase (short-subunit alcohol dehydrogenase family)
LQNKICIVTGANSGIGKETAKALASMGAEVVMVCRNAERGMEAKEEIFKCSSSGKVSLHLADLSILSEVKRVAEEIHQSYPRVDVLINNAGGFFLEKKISEEGIEKTLALNYLSPFYFSNLLIPKLQQAPNARIIIVSSRNQSWGRIHWEDIEFNHSLYNGLQAYSNSKLMTVIFTKELAKRLKDTNITINAAHPGDVVTNIGMHDNNALYKLLWRVKCMFNISPEKGAETPLYLAASKEVENISGHYFAKKKIAKHNRIANEEGIGGRLWEYSEEMISEHIAGR